MEGIGERPGSAQTGWPWSTPRYQETLVLWEYLGPHGTGRQLLVLRPQVVEVDPTGGQERPMGEGAANPGQIRAHCVSHSWIRRPQICVGAQHGLGLPVSWVGLGLTVLTLLVCSQVALLVQGVAVGLLGILVVVLGHGAQLDQLHGVRLLRGVLVRVPMVRRLQVHLWLLGLWQVLHHGLGLVVLRDLQGTLPRWLRLRFLQGQVLWASLLLWVILVLCLLQVWGQHLRSLQGLPSLCRHLG